jgi:hypothetical protein
MDCAAVKPRMEALVNGSLPESERSVAEQHISICEGCRLELELVRAIGSQEKAPAVGKDDWTLDRIFGAEKKSGGANPSESDSASSASDASPASSPSSSGPWGMKDPEAAPSSDAASSPSSDAAADSLFGPAVPASSTPSSKIESATTDSVAEPPRKWGKRADAGPGAGNSWDFEPTDSKSSMKPPEESLFFATEALTRRKDLASKKGSTLRLILWGTGGLVGAALLAFSGWFVLHMNAPAPGDGAKPPAAGASGVPSPDAPAPAPGPGAVQPPENSPPPEETAQPPDNSAQNTPAPPPRTSASSTAPQTMPLGTRATGQATVPTPVTRKTGTRPSETGPPASESHAHATAPSTQTPRPPQTRPNPEPGTRSPQSGPPQPAPTNLSEDTPSVEPDDDSPTETTHSGSSTDGNATPTPKTPHPAPTGMRGSTMWQTQTPKPVEPETEAPAAEVSSPIERLHLATVAAEERGDLATLRRLRVTWKSLMVKIVGPDRSRAKREYADCLWAISDLTGKRADQRDTLAAYREYLLGAPAGGADSRSVSRLRQLEDALTEHR